MPSGIDSAKVTIRYPDDLDIAEAALEGDEGAIGRVKDILGGVAIKHWLVKRGGTPTEAGDLLADVFSDCFGGEKARGGLHRLLGKFNGACKLESFLRRVALNRLISLKRKQKPTVSLDREVEEGGGERPAGDQLAGPEEVVSEDAVIELLRKAVLAAFSGIDQERFVLFRLFHSYRVPQKTIGEMWGWHYSKVCRSLASVGGELRDQIMAKVREADSWLDLEWDDFLDLCGETLDLFDY